MLESGQEVLQEKIATPRAEEITFRILGVVLKPDN